MEKRNEKISQYLCVGTNGWRGRWAFSVIFAFVFLSFLVRLALERAAYYCVCVCMRALTTNDIGRWSVKQQQHITNVTMATPTMMMMTMESGTKCSNYTQPRSNKSAGNGDNLSHIAHTH